MLQTQTLIQFHDLTILAKKGTLAKIIGRGNEIDRLMRIISRQNKNNAILIGDKGVGKTAVVEALASRIIHYDLEPLRNFRLLSINSSQLLLGLMSSSSEQFVKEVVRIFERMKNTIVFFDDLPILLEGNVDYLPTLLYLFQPFFSRDDLRLITTASFGIWRLTLEKNIIISRFLEPLVIEEPDIEQAKEFVAAAASGIMGKYPNIYVSRITSDDATVLAKRYLGARALPDSALDLLDETAASCVLKKKNVIEADDLKQIISSKTGVPIHNLSASDQIKLTNLEQSLKQQIIGQDHALSDVASVIRRSRAGFRDPNRPIGSFLFMGPSGVGKTQLAKTLAAVVYDSEKNLIRLDMSEFSEAHNVQRLIGAPPGYIGYEQGGQLTNPVASQPYSLIVLDEIEKAHPKVFDIFLQVLDEGRLTDGQGKTVDFRNTIIIATSNIALEEIIDSFFDKNDVTHPDFTAKTLLPILMTFFRPEFINRFDAITVFKPLDKQAMHSIAKAEINKLVDRLSNKDIHIKVAASTISEIVDTAYNPTFGARPIKRLLQQRLETMLANQIIEGTLKAGESVEF